mgnify:CR=1 FL=1
MSWPGATPDASQSVVAATPSVDHPEQVRDVQGTREHLKRAIVSSGPFVLGPINIVFDTVAVRIAELQRFADAVVRRALERQAGVEDPAQRSRQGALYSVIRCRRERASSIGGQPRSRLLDRAGGLPALAAARRASPSRSSVRRHTLRRWPVRRSRSSSPPRGVRRRAPWSRPGC